MLDIGTFRPSTYHDNFSNSLASDIHKLIREARWYTWPEGAAKSGTTWVEMLARFDTQGHRSIASIQHKDDDAQHRFLLRSSKVKRNTAIELTAPLAKSSCPRPSLGPVVRTGKATFRRDSSGISYQTKRMIFSTLPPRDRTRDYAALELAITPPLSEVS